MERLSRYSRAVVEGGLWLAILGTGLAWSDALYAEYVLPKLLLLSAGVLVCAIGVALSWLSGKSMVRSTPLDLSLLVVGLTLALTTAFSQDRLVSVLGHYNSNVLGVWPLLLCAAAYYCTAWCGGDSRRRVLRVCLAAGAAVGAYAVLQAVGLEVFARVGELPSGRAISTIGGPVFLGAHLAVLVPLGLHWLLSEKRERPFGLICLSLIATGLWATVSRGSWLGGMAGCGAYLLLRGGVRLPAWSRGRWALLACVVAAVVGLSALRLASRGVHWRESSRIELWRIAARAALDAPLLGSGPATFELDFRNHRTERYVSLRETIEFQHQAHNDFLQALATMGVLGLSAYVLLLIGLGLLAWRKMRSPETRPLAAASLSGLLALFVHAKFNPFAIGALVLGAVFAGALAESGPGRGRTAPGVWPCVSLLLLGCVSTAIALRMTSADWHAKRGLAFQKKGEDQIAFDHLRAAVRRSRCELEYRRLTVNHLIAWGCPDSGDGIRPDLLDLAVAHAGRALDCHPNDMHSHYIRGVAYLMQAKTGRPDRLAMAEEALAEAARRDRFHLPVLEARIKAARLRGDRELMAVLGADLRKLLSVLTFSDPEWKGRLERLSAPEG